MRKNLSSKADRIIQQPWRVVLAIADLTARFMKLRLASGEASLHVEVGSIRDEELSHRVLLLHGDHSYLTFICSVGKESGAGEGTAPAENKEANLLNCKY